MADAAPALVRGPGGHMVQDLPDAVTHASSPVQTLTHDDTLRTMPEDASSAAGTEEPTPTTVLVAPIPGASTLARILAEEKRRKSVESEAAPAPEAREESTPPQSSPDETAAEASGMESSIDPHTDDIGTDTQVDANALSEPTTVIAPQEDEAPPSTHTDMIADDEAAVEVDEAAEIAAGDAPIEPPADIAAVETAADEVSAAPAASEPDAEEASPAAAEPEADEVSAALAAAEAEEDEATAALPAVEPAPAPARTGTKPADELSELAALAARQEAEIEAVKQQLLDMHSRITETEVMRATLPGTPNGALASSRPGSAFGRTEGSVPGSFRNGSPRSQLGAEAVAAASPGRNVSPKDIDAYLRGQGLPSAQREFLRAGAGVSGGRRGSTSGTASPTRAAGSPGGATSPTGFGASQPFAETSVVEETGEQAPAPRQRRRSIAEQLYSHVEAKVDTRRRSVVGDAEADAAAAAAAANNHDVLKAGTGHGGGVTRAASRAGFKADYGARYSQSGLPGGARIWMAGNVDLPAEYGLSALDDELELEDAAADSTFTHRRPTEAYLQYADRMRSLRLRDGGGLVQLLGIDLDEATAAIERTAEEIAANRREHATLLSRRKELHLIVTGPAFGLDLAPAPHVEGEVPLEEAQTVLTSATGRLSQPLRWSNTIIHSVSRASPFRAIVTAGDPVVAIDGESVAHMAFEHVLQRLRLMGARATEAAPHALTVMVTPAALAKAKVIMRAELEHTRREEILARYSASGLAGLDKTTVKIHDDKLAATGSLVKDERPQWRSTAKVARNILTRGTSTFAEIAAAEAARTEGTPEWLHQQQLQMLEETMRTRRSSYADAAGYKGVAAALFGPPQGPATTTGRVDGSPRGELPVDATMRSADSSTGRRAFDPTVYAPIVVPVDEFTAASCRAARGGYTIDVTFTRQPVGILLRGVEVQSTVAGASADGIVLPGDVLVRVNAHDLRTWRKGAGPAPAQLVAEATRNVSDFSPLRLRFYRQGDALPVWAAAALGLPLEGVDSNWEAMLASRRSAGSSNSASAPETSSPTRAARAAAIVQAAIAARDGAFRATPNGAKVAAHDVPGDILRHLAKEALQGDMDEAALDAEIARRAEEDVLLDVSFSSKPFGILLKSLTVAGVINGTQAADILRPGDRIVGLSGMLVWSEELRAAGGVGRVLQAAAASVSGERPFIITFVRPNFRAEVEPQESTISQPQVSISHSTELANGSSAQGNDQLVPGGDAEPLSNGAGAAPQPGVDGFAGSQGMLRRQNTGLEELPEEVDELHRTLEQEAAAAAPAPAPAAAVAQSSPAGTAAKPPLAPGGPGRTVSPPVIRNARIARMLHGEESGYDTEASAWTTAAERARSAQRAAAGGSPLRSGSPGGAPVPRVVQQLQVAFTSVPYFIKFVEGDRDPETGEHTGIYVYKVKRDSYAAEHLRGGDKLVAFGDIDVSRMTLSDVNMLLSAEENIPSDEKPSVLTFHRMVAAPAGAPGVPAGPAAI